MADQKKWFKVWNSILTDPSFEMLPNEILGVWTRLGCLLSIQGSGGKLLATREYFEKHLRCNFETIKCIPNVQIEEVQNDNGTIIVSLKHWFKYQIDSTSYDRLTKYRKRQNDNGARGEENKKRIRREYKEKDKEKEKEKKKRASPYPDVKEPVNNGDLTVKEPLSKKGYSFQVPTLEEVSSYCRERGRGVNPEKWMNHYTSNGWMVGKNKMKDWKASVRTWEADQNPKQKEIDLERERVRNALRNQNPVDGVR